VAWYIDSWSVLDGLAFASQRAADSLDADATVFLSVSDLEPIPVGRMSTALRAQRASFQDGFRDTEGNEIPFDSLDQIREVVRRAYLGGGLGPAPVAIDAPPIDPLLREPERPPAEPPPRNGGGFLEMELERLGREPHVFIDYAPLQNPTTRRALFEAVHREDLTTQFYPYLRAFGEATLVEFVHGRWDRLHLPEEREGLARWGRLLRAIGLWEDGRLLYEDFARRTSMPRTAHDLFFGVELGLFAFAEPLVASKNLLFRIPCPLRATWDRHIGTLGHKLLLPLVDRGYFAANRDLPEFIPVLLCSLVVAVSPTLAVAPYDPLQSVDRHRLLGRALWWLSREMPNVPLPDEVEQLLSDFAWTQLERNPAR
jgi:hypothetical protein